MIRTVGFQSRARRTFVLAGAIALAAACSNGEAGSAHPAESAPSQPSPASTQPAASKSSTHAASTGGASCASTGGKLHGRIIKTFRMSGIPEAEEPVKGAEQLTGGTTELWRSGECGTVWLRVVKLPKYTGKVTEGFAEIDSPSGDNDKVHKGTHEFTRWNIEMPALHLAKGTPFEVFGSFMAQDHEYRAVGHMRM